MRQRDQHRHRELPLEAQRDVDRDQDQRGDDREQGGAGDLLSEGRPDRVPVELRAVHARTPRRARSRLDSSCGSSSESAIWYTELPELGLVDLLDLRVAELRGEGLAHVVDVRLLLERRLEARAGLEVDPEVDALARDAERTGDEDHAGDREEHLRRADEVEAPAFLVGVLVAYPDREARAQQARARQRAEDRRSREHRGEERDDRADAEREREALDAGGRQREEDERDADRHDVRVDDRTQRLRVATGDRGRYRSTRARLLLDAFEDDDVRVGRDREREDRAGDSRQRHRDRDQLHEREQEDRVEHQGDAGDRAEHAVEDEQEQQRQGEAGPAREQALVERLLAERRRHLRLGDQLQLDRQGADPQALGQVLGLLDVPDAVDLRPGAAVDALGVLAVVDRRERDDLVVEGDREALEGDRRAGVLARPEAPEAFLGQRGHGDRGALLAPLRDPLRHRREGLAALVGELHGHDRLVRALVEVLLGVLDVAPAELRVVLEHVVALEVLRLFGQALALDHDDPARHLEDDAAGRRPRVTLGRGLGAGRAGIAERDREQLVAAFAVLGNVLRLALGSRDALEVGEQLLAVHVRAGDGMLVLVEEVIGVLVAVVALVRGGGALPLRGLWTEVLPLCLRLLLGSHLDGLEEPARARVGRVAALPEDVGLPVVELQLGRRAHLGDRAIGVVDVRQADRYLIPPRALDLGLGDAECVRALADRLDRVVHRLGRDRRDLRGRLALVDELDPAAQVEAQDGLLRRDHGQRAREQHEHERDDREVAFTRGHWGSARG